MRIAALATVLLMSVSSAFAAEGEFQLTPRIGFGRLQIDQFQEFEEDYADYGEMTTLGIGVALGYRTPIGIVLEAGTETYGSYDLYDLLDGFELRQHYVALGYQFDLGEGWSLTPKVGRSRWQLIAEEGIAFNPGPEQTDRLRGDEYFGELGFLKRVTDHISLGGAARVGSYDFGHAYSGAFVMMFSF